MTFMNFSLYPHCCNPFLRLPSGRQNNGVVPACSPHDVVHQWFVGWQGEALNPKHGNRVTRVTLPLGGALGESAGLQRSIASAAIADCANRAN
jgi:hypothetical protein